MRKVSLLSAALFDLLLTASGNGVNEIDSEKAAAMLGAEQTESF